MNETTESKTTRDYWDSVWDMEEVPSAVSLTDQGINNALHLKMGELFRGHLLSTSGEGRTVLEAGCGGSTWLPALNIHFDCAVSGVDFSPKGCGLSEAILRKAGVEGTIHQGDIFQMPDSFRESVDVVYSIGLVEHFTPTEAIVEKLAWLVKPGGKVITIVPNMRGATGLLQRLLDRKLYEAHVPLNCDQLVAGHEACGLALVDSGYLGALHLGVANFERKRGTFAYRIYMELAVRSALAVWRLERRFNATWTSRLFSPMVYCVAEKR